MIRLFKSKRAKLLAQITKLENDITRCEGLLTKCRGFINENKNNKSIPEKAMHEARMDELEMVFELMSMKAKHNELSSQLFAGLN